MKRVYSVLFLVLIIFYLYGCASNTQVPGNSSAAATSSVPVAQGPKTEEYFPIKVNAWYSYAGSGNEYATYTVYNDYTATGKVQQRVNNGGTETARILELKDGKLSVVFKKEEVYYRENFLDRKGDQAEVLLMEPLTVGTSWKVDDSRTRTITNVSADITTPLGTYKALEVTTEGSDGKTTDYYAKNVGLVKSVFKLGDSEVSSTLDKIEEHIPLIQSINFYYPKAGSNKLFYISKKINFQTNDDTKQVLEAAYREIAEQKAGKTLNSDVKINNLYLSDDKIVNIDVNTAFLNEINTLGAEYEKLILQSLANTLGHYYNTDKIILTIDNNLYESNNISYKEGEYIKVDYTGSVEEK